MHMFLCEQVCLAQRVTCLLDGFSIGLELAKKVRQAGQGAQGSSCLCLPSAGVWGAHHHARLALAEGIQRAMHFAA